MKSKKMLYPLLVLLSLVVIGMSYWGFYAANERIIVYIVVILLVVFSVLTLLVSSVLGRSRKISGKKQKIIAFSFIGFNVLLAIFSYFQFNYVVMPYEFHVADPFPYGYDYFELKDEVRIEYYAVDYYGTDEIYRDSYDKDEIKEFLDLFRGIEVRMDYEASGSPDIYMNWENDIHVMIRNMDEDNPDSGHYIMSINLVDTSEYALKISGGGVVVFYEVPEDLREFIVEHLLLNE